MLEQQHTLIFKVLTNAILCHNCCFANGSLFSRCDCRKSVEICSVNLKCAKSKNTTFFHLWNLYGEEKRLLNLCDPKIIQSIYVMFPNGHIQEIACVFACVIMHWKTMANVTVADTQLHCMMWTRLFASQLICSIRLLVYLHWISVKYHLKWKA